MSKTFALMLYFRLFLFSVLLLNFDFEVLDARLFIAVLYFSGVVALFMKTKVDKIVVYLWVFITLINIYSNFYASLYLDIPMYKSWIVYWLFIPLILQYIANSVSFFGIIKVLSMIKKLFYLQILISIFALCIMLLGGFSIDLQFDGNLTEITLDVMHALNKHIGILHQYGLSRGFLPYFSIGLYFVVFSILSKKERLFFGGYLLVFTFLLGAKAPLLGFIAVIFLVFINKSIKNYLLKMLVFYIVVIVVAMIVVCFITEINTVFMFDGRYIFPVFIYSDFWLHAFGSGFGNYGLFAFTEVLNFSIDVYTPLLDHPRVLGGIIEYAESAYGYTYSGSNDILFPIAESDLLYFTVQLGAIFTVILFYYVAKILITNINLFFKVRLFNYQHNYLMLFVFLLVSSIFQDYFNSGFSLLFFGFLMVFNKYKKSNNI